MEIVLMGRKVTFTFVYFLYIASTNIYMCEIITMGRRLAHASSLTYRFWGDASREESLFGVTPRARNRFLG